MASFSETLHFMNVKTAIEGYALVERSPWLPTWPEAFSWSCFGVPVTASNWCPTVKRWVYPNLWELRCSVSAGDQASPVSHPLILMSLHPLLSLSPSRASLRSIPLPHGLRLTSEHGSQWEPVWAGTGIALGVRTQYEIDGTVRLWLETEEGLGTMWDPGAL